MSMQPMETMPQQPNKPTLPVLLQLDNLGATSSRLQEVVESLQGRLEVALRKEEDHPSQCGDAKPATTDCELATALSGQVERVHWVIVQMERILERLEL